MQGHTFLLKFLPAYGVIITIVIFGSASAGIPSTLKGILSQPYDISSFSEIGNKSPFQIAGNYLLAIWEGSAFNATFNTFVADNYDISYGHFKAHNSNLFSSDSPIVLYVEPVGSFFSRKYDDLGNLVYVYNNYTVNIIISDYDGNQIAATRYTVPFSTSYHKITEQFFTVNIPRELTLHNGEFRVRYFITDNPTGRTFEISKNIVVTKIGKAEIESTPHSVSAGVSITASTSIG